MISPKKISLALLIAVLLAVGGWIYTRRPQCIVIASYVPESALGYLEINDLPQLADRLGSTKGWRQLAPVYGVENKMNYLGKIGWLAALTRGNEAAVLSRSQIAIVITAVEVRGDEIKPRMALIAETHSNQNDLRKVIDNRLPEFARKIFGRELKETGQYAGVTITSYLAGPPERGLYSAQIGGEWILANHPDPLRACIDARLGRSPSMANNFYLKNSREIVAPSGEMFGFVTGEGVARLLRLGAFLLSTNALRESGVAGALQDVLSDFTLRSSNGVAYGASIENGMVVDRYSLLFKPDFVESLKPAIEVKTSEPQSLNFIPSTAGNVTVFNVENPDKTLDGIETAISARTGVAQGFLLRQFLLGARELFLGEKSGDGLQPAIGDEIAGFDFVSEQRAEAAGEAEGRIWLVAARDRRQALRIAERYFSRQGGAVRRENYSGVEIVASGRDGKSAAAIIGDFLALGRRGQLIKLIEEQRRGQSIKSAPQFTSANKPSHQSAVLSISSVKVESGEMMAALARWLNGSINGGSDLQAGRRSELTALDQLPFAVSAASLNESGVYLETHSPFGNFPFLVSLADGAISGK